MPGGLARDAGGRASPRLRGSPACAETVRQGRVLEMPVGSGLHRAMRRLMVALWLAVMLRPGVMRRRRAMGRGRRHMVMGCGFGFRGNEQGRGGGSKAESGGYSAQERTAAEAGTFGTLHDDLLLRRSFAVIGFPMDLTLLYPSF